MTILDQLGLDPDRMVWQDLAACKNMAVVYTDDDGNEQLFDPLFDSYEDDAPPYNVRKSTDAMCIACPVQQMCYDYGTTNKETGVYGGVYLTNGKLDRTRNEHKTRAVWDVIQEATD